ncbi:MAG: hypothetical protein JO211_08895 [Acidobacteriaceae bacterium]|nr:hypothetical protein [Acidobacteriaceae bacterium]
MRCVCVFLLFALSTCLAADDPNQILEHVRENVAALLKKSANYTCVETIDRSYFGAEENHGAGCGSAQAGTNRRQLMHDRLRLDIVVSENNEIYSWHGENNFSSGEIFKIVERGPISSGSFVGYLRNVFLFPDIQFTFSGELTEAGKDLYTFRYVVPRAASRCSLVTRHGRETVPYHGSFTASAPDYRLVSFDVAVDSIPSDSNMCSAEMEIHYQMVPISGSLSLIPADFVLRVEDDAHIFTTSRSAYAQCREFRGESTLRFDNKPDVTPTVALDSRAIEEWLPAGMTLRTGLRTPIDDRTSYTGDPVEGELLQDIAVPGGKHVIPKGAILRGILAQLEQRFHPWKYYMGSIQFQRITYGNHVLGLKALPITPQKMREQLADMYDGKIPPPLAEDIRNGIFAWRSAHVHLDRRFTGEWITVERPQEANASEKP